MLLSALVTATVWGIIFSLTSWRQKNRQYVIRSKNTLGRQKICHSFKIWIYWSFTSTFLHTHSWLNWVDEDDWCLIMSNNNAPVCSNRLLAIQIWMFDMGQTYPKPAWVRCALILMHPVELFANHLHFGEQTNSKLVKVGVRSIITQNHFLDPEAVISGHYVYQLMWNQV